MRLLILETIDGETAGECVACPLPAATWMWRWQGKATNINGAHRVKALSTVMNAGGTPVRLLILETIDGETSGKHVTWLLPAAMFAQRRRGEAMLVNGNLRIRTLSTAMNAGGTPVRQLILEIVASETAGECVACPLPTATWARRRQGKATNINGAHRVKALSTVMNAGGTPVRQLILEIVASETAGNNVMSPVTLPRPGVSIAANAYPGPRVSRICCLTDSLAGDKGQTQRQASSELCRCPDISRVIPGRGTPMRQLTVKVVNDETAGNHVMSSVALPRPGVSITANAHPGPRVSRINCLTDSPGGDPGWTVARRLGNACRHCDISWVTPRENTPLRRLTIRSNAISPVSRKQSPTRLKPSPGMATNAHPGPVVSRICCLTDSSSGDPGWTVARRLGNACRHCDISWVTPRGNTPLRRLTVQSNAIAPISRKQSPKRLKPSPGMVTNAYPGPVVSRICCLTDSPGGDPGWTVARRLGNACRHYDISDATPRSATPLMTIAAPG